MNPAAPRRRAASLRALAGGDLRSIGRADEAARAVIAVPSRAAALVRGLESGDPVVRMRSADALEKASRARPAVLQPFAGDILAKFRVEQPKEMLWHLLQMAPRIAWRREEAAEIHGAATRACSSSSHIVAVNAMQALVELLPRLPARRRAVLRRLESLARTGSPAVRARGRKLLGALRGKRRPP